MSQRGKPSERSESVSGARCLAVLTTIQGLMQVTLTNGGFGTLVSNRMSIVQLCSCMGAYECRFRCFFKLCPSCGRLRSALARSRSSGKMWVTHSGFCEILTFLFEHALTAGSPQQHRASYLPTIHRLHQGAPLSYFTIPALCISIPALCILRRSCL